MPLNRPQDSMIARFHDTSPSSVASSDQLSRPRKHKKQNTHQPLGTNQKLTIRNENAEKKKAIARKQLQEEEKEETDQLHQNEADHDDHEEHEQDNGEAGNKEGGEDEEEDVGEGEGEKHEQDEEEDEGKQQEEAESEMEIDEPAVMRTVAMTVVMTARRGTISR